MKKYTTFLLLTLLVTAWSMISSAVKYYFWSYFKTGTFHPSLEIITGVISFGGIIACVIGGLVIARYGPRTVALWSAYLTALSILVGMHFGAQYHIVFFLTIVAMGLLYGLWSTAKNLFSAYEIQKTGLPDTLVSGIINTGFLICVILGAVVGALMAEKFGPIGGYIQVAVMIVVGLLTLLCEPRVHIRERSSERGMIQDFFHHVRRSMGAYGTVIFGLAMYWAISIEISQLSVGLASSLFGRSDADAVILLLWCSLGAVVGNVVSMFLSRLKRIGYLVFASVFVCVCIGAPTLITYGVATDMYTTLIWLALALGTCFGGACNIIEAKFLSDISADAQKEYASASYGFITGVVVASVTLISEVIKRQIGYEYVFYLMAVLMLAVSYRVYIRTLKNLTL